MTTSIKPLVMCVDDEPEILEGIKLNVRRKFDLLTATSGQEALQLIQDNNTPAVVLSDMRMPGMNGAEFLSRVRETSPDTVRILLTGYSDLEDTIAAINDGQIFRFLTKPCSATDLLQAIRDGVTQYDLKFAQKVLLEQTLLGSVTAMMDMLSITNPVVFGQATRIRRLCTKIAKQTDSQHVWKLEVASLMSRMGWVALPAELAHKLNRGGSVSTTEAESVERANGLGEQLVRRIPKLDEIAEIIRGSEIPWSELTREAVNEDAADTSSKAQILRIAVAFDALTSSSIPEADAIDSLRKQEGQYDPVTLNAFSDLLIQSQEISQNAVEVAVAELDIGMCLYEDITLSNGSLLAVKGYEITASFKERLSNFRDGLSKQKYKVLIPEVET